MDGWGAQSMTMDRKEFHNGLRKMLNIDAPDFKYAVRRHAEATNGVPPGDAALEAAWVAFRDDPHRFFIRCDEVRQRAIWSLMDEVPR